MIIEIIPYFAKAGSALFQRRSVRFAIARADWIELVEQRDANFTFASGD